MNSAKSLFDRLDPALWIITAEHAGKSGGMVATFVMNASIVDDVPRVVAGVAKQHFTHQLISDSKSLALHLPSRQQVDDVVHFGMQSGHETSKFPWRNAIVEDGTPPELLACVGRMTADVECEYSTGDRTLFICSVTDSCINSSELPMTLEHLVSQISPSQKMRLRDQLHGDAERDRCAIEEWRRLKGLSN
jgi:flavin reductase (DIM6/NTAB) family NADH-FMN oxidoreductase RutF